MLRKLSIAAIVALFSLTAFAQMPVQCEAEVRIDSLSLSLDSARTHRSLRPYQLRPAVFDGYQMQPRVSFRAEKPKEDAEWMQWLDDELFLSSLLDDMRQQYMIANPASVKYNYALLPEAPKYYHIELDPETARLSFVADSIAVAPDITPLDGSEIGVAEIKKQHWLHDFNVGLQFSQAYVSPNWYQGGSNNLAMLFNISYALKLNRNYHPNMMAELETSYKLHVYGTPEDSLRNYNIAEDIFRFAGKFGWKAWRKWFYSVTAQFKTQFFNNYETNDPNLKSAFLSPSELNVGFGMTYEYVSPYKSLNLTLAISPLSYNLLTCTNTRLNPEDFGIEAGHRVKNEIGSGLTFNMSWQMRSNINYTTRIFAFTNYDKAQLDWENTLSFAINRFLSTQIFVHLRYDSTTPRPEGEPTRWHKWQLKEILSFGLAYHFATI